VKGTEDLVSGQGCLHCDICREKIPDFTDNNNIRILTDDVTQGLFKGQVQFFINGALADAVYYVFHRIFGGNDTVFRSVQVINAAVYRGCFAGSCGACDYCNPGRGFQGAGGKIFK